MAESKLCISHDTYMYSLKKARHLEHYLELKVSEA